MILNSLCYELVSHLLGKNVLSNILNDGKVIFMVPSNF